MDYFDIVAESCNLNKGIEGRLGFKSILKAGKDIALADLGNGDHPSDRCIVRGVDKDRLAKAVNSGASAVLIEDMILDRMLMENISHNKAILLIPTVYITSTFGIKRAKNIYRMKKLCRYAMRMRIQISFVTMADSELNLCSSIQLIELAKFLGVEERYAKLSISEANRSIIYDER